MSNMTVHERNQYESANYSGSAERIRRGSERGAIAYSLVSAVVAVALCVAAASLMDGWWQFLVMGVIALTAVGLMIAVNPNRRT